MATSDDDDALIERTVSCFRRTLREIVGQQRRKGMRPHVRIEAIINNLTYDLFAGGLIEHGTVTPAGGGYTENRTMT